MCISTMESLEILVEKSQEFVAEFNKIDFHFKRINNQAIYLGTGESYGSKDKLRDYYCHAGDGRPCKTRR